MTIVVQALIELWQLGGRWGYSCLRNKEKLYRREDGQKYFIEDAEPPTKKE